MECDLNLLNGLCRVNGQRQDAVLRELELFGGYVESSELSSSSGSRPALIRQSVGEWRARRCRLPRRSPVRPVRAHVEHQRRIAEQGRVYTQLYRALAGRNGGRHCRNIALLQHDLHPARPQPPPRHEHAVRDEDIERLSPFIHDDITHTGRYRIALPDPLRDRASYRQLNAAPSNAAAA
jgi:hypothetical protein